MVDGNVYEIRPKVGRPPKRAEEGTVSSLTIKLPAAVKNKLIDLAEAYDMTVTEIITSLVDRAE